MANHSGPLARPFRGLRPTAESAADVIAPPYDVLNTEEARQRASGRPWNFLHISKPEIDLPPGTDPYSDAVYAKGAENLRAMLEAGVLVKDDSPYYYVYRVEMGDHAQTGIVAGGSVAAYEAGRIKRHEFTRPDKEDDRVRQIDSLNAQTGPVMATHRADGSIAEVIAAVTALPPAYSVSEDGTVTHTLWVVADADESNALTAAFSAMDAIYIADGHHRSAAASRVAAARRQANPSHNGDEPYNDFLIVTFPDDEVQILDYNRVVRDLNGLDAAAFLDRIGQPFTIEPCAAAHKPDTARQFGLYLDGAWYRLQPKEAAPAGDPVAALDISLLTDRLLGPVLGIGDPRVDKRIDFVGGIRGMAELERRVDSGEMAAAFAIYPTSLDDLLSVADSGGVMPPKSTWFEPKLADGMVSLVLD